MNRILVLGFLLAAAAPLAAQPALLWGADPTGGAPFVYKSKSDPDGPYIGFEVEIAEYLAKKLGRTSTLVEGDWAQLPEQLKKGRDVDKGVDIVLNGYELRKDLCEQFAATRPYYVFRLSLLARKDSPISDWDDLRGRTSVVLGGTTAHDYLLKRFGDDVKIPTNPDVANVIDLVAKGQFDSTVQDYPAAVHYLKDHEGLKSVGQPVRPGYGLYVIYYRKSDPELGEKLNAAIAEGIRDGTFQKILRKYEIWTDEQRELIAWQADYPPAFDFDPGKDILGDKLADTPPVNPWPAMLRQLLKASWVTIQLAVISFPIAMVIGLLVAIGRMYGPLLLRLPLGIYVEVIRGTPLLLQIYIIYYVIPPLLTGIGMESLVKELTVFAAGVIGLAVNYSAYEAENYRAGLQAVPRGQIEAALSLGMTPSKAVTKIVVPQAVRIVIPSVTNDFIALFKDTAACSIIFVTELTRKYNELANFNRGLIVELAFLTAGLYLLMSYPLAILARRLEQRLTPAGGGRA